MKLFLLASIIVLSCASCASHTDEPYYDRANKANDKAQADLSK